MAKPFAALNSSSKSPTVDEAPILHADLDAFFASVEVLDDPSLRGKPVAVGGAGERGVIASASYEARRFGVRSAMPSVVAKRVCPALVILPGRFDRYEIYSRKFHDVVRDLTPDFEPLGLDEVFADLRSLRRLGIRPLDAAASLRARINGELGLFCGVGLGRNKLFAKLASKESKPRVVDRVLVEGAGVFWVSPELEAQWLCPFGRSGELVRRRRRNSRNSGCRGSVIWLGSMRRPWPSTWVCQWPPPWPPTPTARTTARSWSIVRSSRSDTIKPSPDRSAE